MVLVRYLLFILIVLKLKFWKIKNIIFWIFLEKLRINSFLLEMNEDKFCLLVNFIL